MNEELALPVTTDEVDSHPNIWNTAAILYDQTQSLHALKPESRRLLEWACRLRQVPFPRSQKKFFSAFQEQLQALAPDQLGLEDQRVLAAILACQRGRLSRKKLHRLGLSPIQQREALTLAALLAIAAGLDQSGSQPISVDQVQVSLGELRIFISGAQAQEAVQVAQDRARLWVKIGYPEVKVFESGPGSEMQESFPLPMESPGIQCEDTLAEAGRKVICFQFQEMLSHEAGTRLGEDIEALHDMRVASRRLRAAFEVFESAYQPHAIRPLIQGLRQVGRRLGAVRDLDVALERAQAYQEMLSPELQPGLEPLLQHWNAQRQQAREQMLEHLDSPAYADFKRQMYRFAHTSGAGARLAPADELVPDRVFELAPVLIYTRLATVRLFDRDLANASIEQLHALRIECKKFRYTVEYFREVLGKKASLIIEEMKQIQDHLGALNDAHVAAQILQRFLEDAEKVQAETPAAQRPNLEAVVNYLASRHAERHQLMQTLHPLWRHFNRPGVRRALALAVAAV